MRRLVLAVFLVFAGRAAAEPLPGLLDAKTIEEARREAAHQQADARHVVERHAKALGYSARDVEHALEPTMVRSGHFTVRLDDGTEIAFPWYRTGFAENPLANTDKEIPRYADGAPHRAETNKGGVRLHEGVMPEEVYALALKMDLKLALTRDTLGGHEVRGAKGGIGAGQVVRVGTRWQARVGDYVDPTSAALDRAQLMREFGHAFREGGGEVGPNRDIQAGDVNTKAPEMKVLAESYGSAEHPSAGVSGKEVRRLPSGAIDPEGGIEYRGISTGEGVWMAARLAARHAGVKVRGSTVISQGWGEVGRAFGLAAMRDGARVIGVQEIWTVGGQKVAGVLVHPDGAAAKPRAIRAWLEAVDAARRPGEDLATFQGGALLSHLKRGVDAAEVRADIVGVNALGRVLNDRTVPAYVASGTHHGGRKIIVEGANLAETREGARLADHHRDRLLVVPGDLANIGGVHVSNLEAAQNMVGQPVTNQQARRSLSGTLRGAWAHTVRLADKDGLSEREAAERWAVQAMLRRSLHQPDAPRDSVERRAFGRSFRAPRH
jgi:glutamate dehydrogenase/leucine dehydrogenase